jgi:hypothetical protein
VNTTGQDGFFFFVPSVRKVELISRIETAGAVQASGEDMRPVRIEHGKPRAMEKRLRRGVWRKRRDYATH